MRIMAIDYGDAHTGVAISDMGELLASTVGTMDERDPGRLAERLCALAEKLGAGLLVLGYPKNMNATLGERAAKSEALAEALRAGSGLDVVLWDERRTTVDAHRILSEQGKRGKKRKEKVDAVAAALILEGYLNYRRSRRETGEKEAEE